MPEAGNFTKKTGLFSSQFRRLKSPHLGSPVNLASGEGLMEDGFTMARTPSHGKTGNQANFAHLYQPLSGDLNHSMKHYQTFPMKIPPWPIASH
jgi:hypothetical protein